MNYLNATARSRKLERIPVLIRQANIPVPQGIADALHDSRRTTRVDGTARAHADLFQATNDADWNDAASKLATAMAIDLVAKSDEYRAAIENYRVSVLERAIIQHAPALIDELCAKYNQHVPAFTNAVNRIPDLEGMKPADVSAEVSAAIQEAKELSSSMSATWDAYRALVGALGYDVGLGSIEDCLDHVFRLGDVASLSHARNAAALIKRYSARDSFLQLGFIAPHVAILRVGGSLELVPPDQAEDRRENTPLGPDRIMGYGGHFA